LAVVPWGALEWHGPHLPLGLDGLVAETFAERVAAAMDGVVFPTYWVPITTLPHRYSLQHKTETVQALWRELLAGLRGVGFQVVALISGHYAQGHELELYAAAQQAMRADDRLRVLAAAPLELLGDEALLDHAGRWETAQLLASHPELVQLERFPGMLGPAQVAVLGEDPRLATRVEGEAVLARAAETWSTWLTRALTDEDPAWLNAFYARRAAAYAGYKERYYTGDWETALLHWWNDKHAHAAG
jgi:creatinine amidohydrolase